MYTATIYRGYNEGNITLTIGTQRSLPRCYNLFCAIYRGIPLWSRCNALQPLRRVIAAIQRPGEFCDAETRRTEVQVLIRSSQKMKIPCDRVPGSDFDFYQLQPPQSVLFTLV